MLKWWKKKQTEPEPSKDPWDDDPVSDTPTFRGDYEGEGVWYECGNCDAIHELDEGPAYRGLIEDLCTSVSESSQQAYDQFGLGTGEGRWDVIPDEGLIKFTNADGRMSMASYGVVSSWNDQTHSWLWAWAMPEGWIPPAALKVCQALKTRADEEGDWDPVQYGTLFVNEHEAWHLTNLAAWANDMPMVYRAKVNEMNWHYFAIGKLTWAN